MTAKETCLVVALCTVDTSTKEAKLHKDNEVNGAGIKSPKHLKERGPRSYYTTTLLNNLMVKKVLRPLPEHQEQRAQCPRGRPEEL